MDYIASEMRALAAMFGIPIERVQVCGTCGYRRRKHRGANEGIRVPGAVILCKAGERKEVSFSQAACELWFRGSSRGIPVLEKRCVP
jgi:hypothetical protein